MNKKHILNSRKYRVYHRKIGLILIFFVIFVSFTGFLLGVKDEFGFKPKTNFVETSTINEWISLIQLDSISKDYVYNQLKLDTIIDRIDYRPSKGIVKVLFKSHFTELQINVQTGDILSVSRRFDTIIEKLHDGSIFDFYFTNSNISKIIYTLLLSFGIMFVAISGFLLWYYPKKIKKNNAKNQ